MGPVPISGVTYENFSAIMKFSGVIVCKMRVQNVWEFKFIIYVVFMPDMGV